MRPNSRIAAYLFCDGGEGKGYGNLYRTAALADSLRLHGVAVTLIYAAPLFPDTALPDHSIPLVQAPRGELIHTLDALIGGKPPASKLISIDSREVIPEELTALRINIQPACLVHLNDAGLAMPSLYDVVVDPDEVNENGDSNIKVLSGPGYSIVRRSITRLRPLQLSLPTSINNILLCMGAEDPENVTGQLVQSLQELQGGSSSVTIICGDGYDQDTLRRLLSFPTENFSVFVSPANFPDLIANADLVVSLGGQTTLEACCLGRLNACVEWAWLSAYVRKLATRGVIYNLGSIPSAASALVSIAGNPLSPQLAEIAASGWRTIDGKGADRLAAELISTVQENR